LQYGSSDQLRTNWRQFGAGLNSCLLWQSRQQICKHAPTSPYLFRYITSGLAIIEQWAETVIVSAADKEIGKFLFINQEPFDFCKLELVIKLLGEHHKRRLLVE
jgi:hypothetical protein